MNELTGQSLDIVAIRHTMVSAPPPHFGKSAPVSGETLTEVRRYMSATDATAVKGLQAALRQIPCGIFILSAAADGHRGAVMTRWVQPCSLEPPLLMTSVPTGLAIEPLIRNSRAFAIGQIADSDRLLRRRFAAPFDRSEDPFITIPHWTTPNGAPVPERVHAWFECELIRHVDLDSDHRLLVGRILSGGIHRAEEAPAIEVGGVSLPPPVSASSESAITDSTSAA